MTFAIHLAQLQQAAAQGMFRTETFLETTQGLFDALPAGSEEAHRLSGVLSHFHDLTVDNRLSRESVLEAIERSARGDYTALVTGYSYFDLMARGGEAAVYRALRRQDGRVFALKVAHTANCDETAGRERRLQKLRANFREEWEALQGVDSDFVIKAYQQGETESGKPYLALEYMDVGALSVYVRGRILEDRAGTRDFPMDERLQIAIRMASGLAVFHENGLLHRDVKMGNYLINRHGEIKLGDPCGTHADEVRGTLGHLSAETKPSAKKDVFALGTALYILFTEKIPFDPSRAYKALFTPPPPSEVNPRVPKALDRIVMQAIDRAPATRTPNAIVLLRSLEKAAKAPSMRPERRRACPR